MIGWDGPPLRFHLSLFLSLSRVRCGQFSPCLGFALLDRQLEELHIREGLLATLSAASLQSLASLRHLIVERTPLTSLPPLAACRSLARLHVDDSRLERLPSGLFDRLPLLTSVQITRAPLSVVESGSFARLEHLHNLNLSANRLTRLPAGAFQSLPHLQVRFASTPVAARLGRDPLGGGA